MNQTSRVQLVDLVTCPYCWNQFPPEDVYWISRHSHLSGDAVAGASELHRFLPSRFTLTSQAYDEKGNICENIACPICHGFLPKAILEMPQLCFSVLGAPASGKSFFLGAMLQRMKHVFTKNFELELESAAPAQNQMILNYQRTLFEYDDPNSMKMLDKTQMQGVKGLYREIRLNDEDCTLSIPCMFSIKPSQKHPLYTHDFYSRMLCLYDCAGEYFEPQGDHTSTLVVKHLENSDMLLFVYDPYMESDFRRVCAEVTNDPQVSQAKYRRTKDQSAVLSYAADLIRRGGNHPSRWKYDRPLVVLVNKVDGWQGLLKDQANRLDQAMMQLSNGMTGLDLDVVQQVSNTVRTLLRELGCSIVTAAESFANEVFYIPATSTGVSPQVVNQQNGSPNIPDQVYPMLRDEDEPVEVPKVETIDLGFRAGDLSPKWTEIPLLLALSRSGLRKKMSSLIFTDDKQLQSYEQIIPLRNKRSGG